MSAQTENVKVTLDGEFEFDAYSMGEPWNGWLVPIFTFEQVEKLKAWFETGEQGTITYDAKSDEFAIKYSWDENLEFEKIKGTDSFDGVRIYEWASFGWSWDLVGE
jgi:hypothetical protein